MNWVCVNGDFLPAEEAKISVWDHGFLYGDGLFETMRAYSGKIFALEDHLQRLHQGAQVLRQEIPWKDSELKQFLTKLMQLNNLAEAYIRLTITRGAGSIGLDPALCQKASLVIMAKQPVAVNLNRGIDLGVCPIRRNHPDALPPAIKSLNFLNNILAKIWAKENGYSEALMLSQEGWITESTVSNIFFVHRRTVYTPGLAAGVLAGVTRKHIIEAVKNLGLDIEEGNFTFESLQSADEIFLTNSGSEVIPVTYLNGVPVGTGIVGILTKSIHRSFKNIVEKYLE